MKLLKKLYKIYIESEGVELRVTSFAENGTPDFVNYKILTRIAKPNPLTKIYHMHFDTGQLEFFPKVF